MHVPRQRRVLQELHSGSVVVHVSLVPQRSVIQSLSFFLSFFRLARARVCVTRRPSSGRYPERAAAACVESASLRLCFQLNFVCMCTADSGECVRVHQSVRVEDTEEGARRGERGLT